jgi:hypothetical protein
MNGAMEREHKGMAKDERKLHNYGIGIGDA